jgi:AraC-like DNA-binding protein
MGCDLEVMAGHLVSQPPRSTWAQGASGETSALGGVVQEIVTRLLPGGYPDVHSVAKILGLSVRTLQRRLFDEGVPYIRIVARARLNIAQCMLDDPACKVIDVALDLGYSDQAHLARAFVRWTGLAPREFQRLGVARALPGRDPVNERLVRANCPAPSSREPGHRDHRGPCEITVRLSI